MMRYLALLPLLSACGGVATVDLFFVTRSPPRDGSTNLALVVTEGAGTAQQILDTHIAPFDSSFDARIRVPYGGQRMVLATLETDEAQPRVLFSGRSSAFRLEEGDSPTITVQMVPVPPAGTAMLSATAGRVGSATVTFTIAGVDATGVSISDDPFFSSVRTEEHRINDLPTTRMDIFPPQFEVNATYVIDDRCTDRLGCPRTVYFRLTDSTGFPSTAFSSTFIYDPFPPRLLDATIRIEGGAAVLGGSNRAEVITELDEQAVLSTFAALSGGSAACPSQVEVVDGEISGSDFPLDCAGTYTIEITAMDLAGNSARLFEVATLPVDRAPPAPVDISVVTSSCAGQLPLLFGAEGAAEPRAIVDANGVRARSDDRGAFILATEAGQIQVKQLDAAGNESVSRTFEVMSCGS